MTQLISPEDPQYFTKTSDRSYDRHHYEIVSKTGESVVVEDYMLAQATWFQKSSFLSHINVLDIQKRGKGFA
jgi:hypothetical protein